MTPRIRTLRRKAYQITCSTIRKIQQPIVLNDSKGFLTIFHDYEGSYGMPGKNKASYEGVSALLKIEKKYNKLATFNVVGRLFQDYPDIIKRIIDDGHDLASHTMNHEIIVNLSYPEIKSDLKDMADLFKQHNLNLQGFRACQSLWNFNLIKAMSANKLKWSAEDDDAADHPFYIFKNRPDSIVRFPIKMDDWAYISENLSPDTMYKRLLNQANYIKNKKCYGAIGFHPWIQGENSERLKAFEKFIKTISGMENLETITFGQAYELITNERK